jgi:hypothetical protein
MAIKKRANLWQIDITINGIRHRVTEKTRVAAQKKEKELMAKRDPSQGLRNKKSGISSPRHHPLRIQSRLGTVVASSRVM